MGSKTNKQKVGEIGENVACRFLMKHNFEIIERNYWKKWGEIDIIAKKNNILHFIEVKTVSTKLNCVPRKDFSAEKSDTGVSCRTLSNVTYETDSYRPEDNIHPWKLKRLSRTIQTYLLEKGNDDLEWQFDAIAVYLDMTNKKAKIDFLEDVVI
ncbi:MAG: YraN family protein [Parcubacteria group bacterium]|nr:YraN family protein [Parcubacteria group bacterium]